MTKCPYCGGKINTSKELPKMTPLQFSIFNALLNKGRNFTPISNLSIGDRNETTVRVAICYLNKKLKDHGMVIVNRNGIGYRLEEA